MSKIDLDITEKNLQDRVIRYLKKLGFLFKKNQEGLRFLPQADGTKKPYKASSGFPDIEVFLENGSVIFLEIKRENGKVSERQEEMFNELDNNTFTILIVRPSNWEKVKEHLKWLAHSYNLWNDKKAYVEQYNKINIDCGWRYEYEK